MTQFIQVNGVPAPITRQGRTEDVSFSATKGVTVTPISRGVKAVVIAVTEDCRFAVGDASVDVTANTGSLIYAGSYYFALVKPGEHLAFIRVSTDGLANITECAA